MKTSRAVLLAFTGLTGCGGIAVVEEVPDPWGAAPGVAAPLPPNGSSPASPPPPSGSDPESWSGWWVRFPSYGAYASDIEALGDDAVLAGMGVASSLDLGSGPLAADLPADEWVAFIARVSTDGELLWSNTVPGASDARIAVDASSRIHVAMPHGLRSYGADGQPLAERTFGEHVETQAVAAEPDGGLLVGLDVAGGPVDLGAGPLPLAHQPPVGLLARFDAQGHPAWWREVSIATRFIAVGADGAGRLLAVTTGDSQAVWGDFVLDAGASTEALFIASFDSDGVVTTGSVAHGFDDAPSGVTTMEDGMLLSAGVAGPLIVDGSEVAYGGSGGYEQKGVVVRVDGAGQYDSFLALGTGPHSVAPGPDRMVAGSSLTWDPLGLVWCSQGVEPCDRYSLPETEAMEDRVAVRATGGVVFMTGQVRLTPAGSLAEEHQLYVMKLMH